MFSVGSGVHYRENHEPPIFRNKFTLGTIINRKVPFIRTIAFVASGFQKQKKKKSFIYPINLDDASGGVHSLSADFWNFATLGEVN